MEKKPKRENISRTDEKIIFEKYHGRCAICNEVTPFDQGVVDHIKSVSKGGSSKLSNLQWLCHRCNFLKGYDKTNVQVKKILKKK